MLGKTQEAQNCFLKSINIGAIYDARVRRICLQQLIVLLQKQQKPVGNLQSSLANFQHRNRDFVFLVSRAASQYDAQIKTTLRLVFDNETAIGDSDRICLITYAGNTKCIFSLVEKNCNFTQLRNQINKMQLGSS
jgi:hypothetical protein